MRNLKESTTRERLIDPALQRAGWDLRNRSQIKFEIPVDGENAEPWNGITDYSLYRPNGEIIAIVEAKRTIHDARLAQQQAEHYATEIGKRQAFAPFVFLSNGVETHFYDFGYAAQRLVPGFFSPDDLERLLFIRRNKTALSQAPINNRITDRAYQHEAIRRISEAIDAGKRKALLVMATGTGKTRTVVSLVDLFLRTGQAQKVLFVADRDALVEQALTDGFKTFLPDEPRGRLYSYNLDTTKRLYAVTLQTLSNIFEKFTPAFFDLIIFDEVHRSIFNKFDEVLTYFDARMIGLTATPAGFIDRNTFRVFECNDGKPTFLYTYEQAMHDKYLVPFELYAARTKFQRKGIKGVDLSEEERNALMEQGIDPDDIDFEGSDLETRVSNKDTLRQQWQEIWDSCVKDESGQLPGKTIVFALTNDHALRLQAAFDEMFPQFPDLCRVITYKSDYRGQLVEHFKKEDVPRIAISVDMLDTGIDVPEAVNLVFMKPVQSQIKLQQMIGRGTRPHAACKMFQFLPNGHKDGFLILDFWENEFNKKADETTAQTTPVLVTIFNTRLKQLELDLDAQAAPEFQRSVKKLREQIDHIPTESFAVKKVLPQIQEAWEDSFWMRLNPRRIEFLKLQVAPLLRYAVASDVDAATFVSKIERLKLQQRTNKDASATRESIADDVTRLPDFVVNDPAKEAVIQLGASPEKLAQAKPAELDALADTLAQHMKNRRQQANTFLLLDLPDSIDMRGYILLRKGTEPVYVQQYRERIEKRIQELVTTHPAMLAIQRGEMPDDWLLIDLERTLRHELGGGDTELDETNIRKAYGLKVGSLLAFLRALLGLDNLPDYGDVVERQFQAFVAQHAYNADQILFLRTVQSVLLQRRKLEPADLYEAPFTNWGNDAVERLFTPREVDEVLEFAGRLAA